MKNHITEALSWGNPVMVNTMESPGDVYLQGHNIGTALYHFGVIGDYFDNGNSVTYVDPGYGRFCYEPTSYDSKYELCNWWPWLCMVIV